MSLQPDPRSERANEAYGRPELTLKYLNFFFRQLSARLDSVSETLKAAWIGVGGAVIGGIVGGLLTILSQCFLEYVRRPVLSINFKDDDYHKVESKHPMSPEGTATFMYIRVRVCNKKGRQVAKECRLFLADLEMVSPTGETAPTAFLGSRQLAWAGFKSVPLDLPSGLEIYADVVRFLKSSPSWGIFSFEHFSSESRLNDYKGTYRLHIVATSDNAEPATLVLDITYNGDWDNIEIKVVPAPSWEEQMQSEPRWVSNLK